MWEINLKIKLFYLEIYYNNNIKRGEWKNYEH